MRRVLPPLQRAAVLIAVVALISCSERQPSLTAPSGGRLRASLSAAPESDELPPPSGTFTVTLPASGNSAAYGPVEFATYDRKIRVEIKVTGYIYRYISPNPPWNPDIWNMLERYYGPGGTFSRADLTCYGNVFVLFSPLGGYVPCAESNAVELDSTWIDTVVVQGIGRAQRTNVPDPSSTIRCGFPFPFPCYYYLGTTAVTTTPVATQLIVVVDSSHVHTGSNVKFTARRKDGRAVSVTGWEWHPGSGGSTPGPTAGACGATDSTCVTALTNTSPSDAPGAQTGKMYARAIIDGVEEVAGVAVTVDPSEKRKLEVSIHVTPGGLPPARLPPRCGLATDNFEVTVRARWSDGSSTEGLAVRTRSEFLAETGGHAHQAQDRAGFGAFTPAAGALSSGGEFTTRYRPGEVSGFERLIGIVSAGDEGADSASGEVRILVPGLIELISGGNVEIGGGLPQHPRNTFATAFTIGEILLLADTFFAVTHERIPFNDISLQWGGLFDLDRNFTAASGHAEHRCGQEVDVVDASGELVDELEGYLELLVRSPLIRGGYLRHGPGSYHLRFRRL